jgi:hypothetical protein
MLKFLFCCSKTKTFLSGTILMKKTDLAYQIALDYRHLINEKDGDGMTSLQLLSCNQSAFKQEPEDGFIKLGMHTSSLPFC